jgi:hypothetical protein
MVWSHSVREVKFFQRRRCLVAQQTDMPSCEHFRAVGIALCDRVDDVVVLMKRLRAAIETLDEAQSRHFQMAE